MRCWRVHLRARSSAMGAAGVSVSAACDRLDALPDMLANATGVDGYHILVVYSEMGVVDTNWVVWISMYETS